MRKLIYISLAALTLQTCAGVQAASQTPTPAVVIPPTTSTATPQPLTKSDQAALLAQAGSNAASQWAQAKEAKAQQQAKIAGDKAVHWYQKAGQWVKKEAIKADCDTDFAGACGLPYQPGVAGQPGGGAGVAIQELGKCHTVPNSAKGCFRHICDRLNAQPGTPYYDKAYIDAVTPVLSPMLTDPATQLTPAYWLSLGCTPPLANTTSSGTTATAPK